MCWCNFSCDQCSRAGRLEDGQQLTEANRALTSQNTMLQRQQSATQR